MNARLRIGRVAARVGATGAAVGLTTWLAGWALAAAVVQDPSAGRTTPPSSAASSAPAAAAPAVPSTTTVTVPVASGNTAVEPVKPRIRTSFFQAARDSLFGRTDYATWEPLKLNTFFSEGWDEAWIGPPRGLRGSPRQGWIGGANGNFYRLAFLSFDYTRALAQGGDGYASGFTLFTPLSRRLLLITQVPFFSSNLPSIAVGKQAFPVTTPGRGGTTNPVTGRHHIPSGFGDLAFTWRVMLKEIENFSLTAELTVQTPTGYRPEGAGQALVTPGVQFWWNFAERWVARGAFNEAIGTNRQAGGTTLVSQLAIGRTFTEHDVPLFW